MSKLKPIVTRKGVEDCVSESAKGRDTDDTKPVQEKNGKGAYRSVVKTTGKGLLNPAHSGTVARIYPPSGGKDVDGDKDG